MAKSKKRTKSARTAADNKTAGRRRAKPAPTKRAKPTRPTPAPRASSSARAITSPAERRADERLVECTIDLLRAHDRTVSQSERHIGEHLIDEYFGGDVDLARSHDPTKARSYARLVARAAAETEWDAADFRRAVLVAIVARSLPSGMADEIAASRLVRLAAIDDPTERVALATRVARGELDDLAFRELVARAAGVERRGGRERAPGPSRIVAGVERVLDLAEEVDAFDTREIARVPDSARDALRRRLRDAIDRLHAMVKALG